MEHHGQMVLIHAGLGPAEYLPHEVVACVGAEPAHDTDGAGLGIMIEETLDQSLAPRNQGPGRLFCQMQIKTSPGAEVIRAGVHRHGLCSEIISPQ
jgi:hypothetical protein